MPKDQLQIRLTGLKPIVGEAPKVYLLREEIKGIGLSDDLQLLRYMSLAKFVNMLATGGLWFSRLDLLGDSFEGAAPNSDLSTRSNPEIMSRVWTAWRRWLVVSCWYSGPSESDAMWNIFAPDGEGLAIRTSISALKDAMELSTEHYADSNANAKKPLAAIFLGQVLYVDHARTHMDDQKLPFGRAFLKRLEFSHEREIRVVAPLPDIFRENGVDCEAEPALSGITTLVDISKLLDEIIVCPTAPVWYIKNIESLLRAFEIEVPIRVSDLAGKPRF